MVAPPAAKVEPSATHIRPSTVLLLRTPVGPNRGTDPYHDAFGAFCLPSFPVSALDSGAATPIALPHKNLPNISAHAAAHHHHHHHHHKEGASAPPRPEELLLHALQQQQQKSQQREDAASEEHSRDRRHSPHRNYTRQKPTYSAPDGAPASASDADVATRGGTSSSPILTTHHIATQNLTSGQASSLGLDGPTESCSIQREWCVTSVPVIGSQATHEDELEQLLVEGQWSAVVATSNRAWDVWKKAAQSCDSKGKKPATNFAATPFFLISPRAASTFRSSVLPDTPADYAPAPTKVYGAPGAAKPSKEGDDEDGATQGDKSSAGHAMGEYIAGWFERRRAPATAEDENEVKPLAAHPLLILQGDKSLAALPTVLTERGLDWQNIVVYQTCADAGIAGSLDRVHSLLHDLAWTEKSGTSSRRGSGASTGSNGGLRPKALLKETQMTSIKSEAVTSSPEDERSLEDVTSPSLTVAQDKDALPVRMLSNLARRPDWIVFFSPSGVDFAADALRARGWLPPVTDASSERSHGAASYPHYLALGPTTAAHLKDKYGLPDAAGHKTLAVAEKPEPSGVKEGIAQAEIDEGSLLL
ncbi:unnamed protein product [Parajaminaea phylloscopi]